MKVGLFFGSFNPIHHAHLIIANHILNEGYVDRIWFMVSPQNPLKETASLLNENHRLHLIHLAIQDDPRMKASDIEFGLPRPSYTAVTLAHLKEKYPAIDFYLILGGDSFQNIKRWKNYSYILENYKILVYGRPGIDLEGQLSANITLLKAPLLQLSATQIRTLIAEKKSIRFLVPDAVIEEIEKGGYYRK